MHFLKILWKLVNFCAAILILKMEENTEHFWHIKLYYFKKNATETQEKICAVYGEGAVTDGTCQKCFAKFLGIIDIWPNNSLPWGCLMHWKMFSSTPGLCPLEANNRRWLTYSNIQISKVIGENEKFSLLYGKK